jgi:hypothetical protein
VLSRTFSLTCYVPCFPGKRFVYDFECREAIGQRKLGRKRIYFALDLDTLFLHEVGIQCRTLRDPGVGDDFVEDQLVNGLEFLVNITTEDAARIKHLAVMPPEGIHVPSFPQLVRPQSLVWQVFFTDHSKSFRIVKLLGMIQMLQERTSNKFVQKR